MVGNIHKRSEQFTEFDKKSIHIIFFRTLYARKNFTICRVPVYIKIKGNEAANKVQKKQQI